jgi:hypothetical protein
MGEIADWLLGQSMDAESLGIDDYGENELSCRYCGEYPLLWGKKGLQWRLVDEEGMPHCCAEYLSERRKF